MENNNKINFTPFTPNQIEVRPTNTKFKGKCSLLLYIDSRAVGKILNDTFGNFNWQIDYKNLGDKIYGTLSIWDNTKQQWVGKTDTGSASEFESDKGQASDILKRCLARWGADFLYSAPDITIKCPDNYYYNDKLFMSFRVKEIGYDENKKINHLIIVDKLLKLVTLDVSRLGMVVSEVQFQNNRYILVTLDVLKFGMVVNDEQPSNKLLISVTLDVSI